MAKCRGANAPPSPPGSYASAVRANTTPDRLQISLYRLRFQPVMSPYKHQVPTR